MRQNNRLYYPHHVEIETVRHCNAKCIYCPQSFSRMKEGIISPEVFEIVLSRLGPYSPTWVSLTTYGEALLYPSQFKHWVESLARRGLSLFLFTNATLLTDELIEFLKDQKMYGMVFNFPSLDPAEWSQFMQLPQKAYFKARNAIEICVEEFSGKFKEFRILVNGVTNNQNSRIHKIKRHFKRLGNIEVIENKSHSRAGSIDNEYVESMTHFDQETFAGCERMAGNLHLHVSLEGKCFLCCHDYHQKVILGDLLKNDIQEIMQSKEVLRLRAEIFGDVPMRKDLICRSCVKLYRNK